jgi:mRNA interferase RelE/StbE
MEIIVTKTFTKQYLRCPSYVKEDVQNVINELEKANSLTEIKEIKKMKGFKKFYRIRAGQYRIGLKEQKPGIFLLCVMERSQIYKVFPPQ